MQPFPTPFLLVLENFQSLRERTEIPISPLTFLYGPNSGGKSSILDAFTFIDAVLNSSEKEIKQLCMRWTHISDAKLPTELNFRPMTVAVSFTAYDIFGHLPSFAVDRYFPAQAQLPGEIWTTEFKQNFVNSSGPFELKIEAWAYPEYGSEVPLALTFSAGGVEVFKVRMIDEDESDIVGEYALVIFSRLFGNAINDLAERHGQVLENNSLSKILNCQLSYAPLKLEMNIGALDDYDYSSDLISIANFLLAGINSLSFTPKEVSADRKTIGTSDLTTVVHQESPRWGQTGLPSNFLNASSESTSKLKTLASDVIERLALARFVSNFSYSVQRSENPRQVISNELRDALYNSLAPNKNPESVDEFTNRCLSQHLFLDQGYQVVFEFCEILPSASSEAKPGPMQAAIAVCSLLDKANRRLTFEDVGTGISCVLPVLISLHSSSSFIQQPELHLHPALQSALGDIFVEATKVANSCHFIETHSEYILLRCLRRVRETTAGKHPEGSPLALTPDALSVLYFEPQSDGSTRVKNIRVSTQGDFIDRWPRGFFEERGKELFDDE